jgi:hypothetical protein
VGDEIHIQGVGNTLTSISIINVEKIVYLQIDCLLSAVLMSLVK